jgi:hypothetical protein
VLTKAEQEVAFVNDPPRNSQIAYIMLRARIRAASLTLLYSFIRQSWVTQHHFYNMVPKVSGQKLKDC